MVEKIKLALERAYKERNLGVSSVLDSSASAGEDTTVVKPTPDIVKPFDVTTVLGGAQYCLVDTSVFSEKRIFTVDDENPNTEQFRLLRSKLLYMLKMERLSTIGITSPGKQVGKTLASVNLAISLARSSEVNVVLIDGDVSNPSIHKLLGIESKLGLLDMLTGNVDIRDVILRLSIPNLWLVPGRDQNTSLLDQATSNRVEQLVNGISVDSGSIIIVDLPPVLGKDETVVFASNLDVILMVVGEGVSKLEEVDRACDLLKQCNLMGSILNRPTNKI